MISLYSLWKSKSRARTCRALQLSLNLATNSLGSRHKGLSKLNHVKTAWLHQCLANPLHWIKHGLETLMWLEQRPKKRTWLQRSLETCNMAIPFGQRYGRQTIHACSRAEGTMGGKGRKKRRGEEDESEEEEGGSGRADPPNSPWWLNNRKEKGMKEKREKAWGLHVKVGSFHSQNMLHRHLPDPKLYFQHSTHGTPGKLTQILLPPLCFSLPPSLFKPHSASLPFL